MDPVDTVDPDPDSDPDPQHCFILLLTVIGKMVRFRVTLHDF